MRLKALYKTVWEIKQRILVDMAADRGAFIDQSQSFNVHMSDPNFGKLTSLHFYTWKKGLKTGGWLGVGRGWAVMRWHGWQGVCWVVWGQLLGERAGVMHALRLQQHQAATAGAIRESTHYRGLLTD